MKRRKPPFFERGSEFKKLASTAQLITALRNPSLGYGADLDNLYTGITQPVTVNGGTFNANVDILDGGGRCQNHHGNASQG